MSFRVDPHMHYKSSSRASSTHEEAMCDVAKKKGLDAIVFTEHHCVLSADRLADLNVRFAPLKIFQGIEITVWERRDYLVYGVPWDRVRIPRMKRISRKDLLELVATHSAAACIAHPLCYPETTDIAPEFFTRTNGNIGIHAIEIASGYIALTNPASIRTSAEIGSQHKWTLLCGSDAHEPKHAIGWCSILREPLATEADFVSAVKNPRAWI